MFSLVLLPRTGSTRFYGYYGVLTSTIYSKISNRVFAEFLTSRVSLYTVNEVKQVFIQSFKNVNILFHWLNMAGIRYKENKFYLAQRRILYVNVAHFASQTITWHINVYFLIITTLFHLVYCYFKLFWQISVLKSVTAQTKQATLLLFFNSSHSQGKPKDVAIHPSLILNCNVFVYASSISFKSS